MNGFFPLHWADKSGNTRAGINGIIGNCIGGILYSDYKVFLNTSVLPTPFPIISSLSLFNRPANFKLRLLVDFSCTNYSNISETMSYHVIDRFEISKYSSFFNKTFLLYRNRAKSSVSWVCIRKAIRFVSRIFTRELSVIPFRFCFAYSTEGRRELSVTKASARFASV